MNPFRRPDGPARTPVLASIPTPRTSGGVSTLRLYDAIDPWGGEWGVSSKEFTAAIDALPDDTTEIRLLINSPGGTVFEGIAIMNALRSHPARVVAVVEGIAASSASFIAASADELVMMRNSELFIHNAWVMAVGDAVDLRAMADDLEQHFDRNIASVYAAKSGKDADHWLGEMHKDRYLTAEQAVAEGLADRVDGDGDAAAARARFDLSAFNTTTPRAVAAVAATPPKPPAQSEPGEPNRKDADTMSDFIKAGLAKRLGITDAAAADLSDEELFEALDEVLEEQADSTPEPAPIPEGAVLIEAGALATLQSNAEAGVTALAAQTAARRDQVIQAALTTGRITVAQAPDWRAQLDRDEAGITALIASFPANTIPVVPIGVSDGLTSAEDALYAEAFGEEEVTA